MVEPLKDELLSAYLDDALSAADRDRVERHLAVNPEDRQLVDELRVLHESLQSLPRHELPATFRDKVLRQAERAMLTQPVETPVAAQGDPPRRPKWLPVGGYRTLAWPAAVLAAAIILMVVYQEGPDNKRDVAQVVKPRAGAAEGEDGGRRTPLEIGPRTVDKSDSEMVEVPQLKESLAKEGLLRDGLARENLARENLARENLATENLATENLATEGLATEGLTIAAKQPAGGPPSESSPAVPRTPAAADAFASTPEIATKAAERVELRSSTGRSGSRAGKAGAGLGDMQQAADRYAGSSPFDSPERGLQDRPAVDSLEAAGLQANQPFVTQGGLRRGILLVQVDVSRTAAKAHAFEKLLERQRIVPQQRQQFVPRQNRDQPAPTALRRQVERSGDELGLRAKKAVERKKTVEEEPAPSDPLDRDAAGPAPEGVEMFYVEATESQVQAALNDLNKRNEEFPVVAVQPDPSQPWQAQFGAYQRGRQGEDWQYYFAYWKDHKKANLSSRAFGFKAGGYGRGGGQRIAAGLAGEDGVSKRGEAAGSSSAAAEAGLGQKRAKGAGPAKAPEGDPLARVARQDEKATETSDHLVERDANRSGQVDREGGEQAKQSAVEESRGSHEESFRRKQRAGQQVQEADGQHANDRLLVQQVPAASAPEAPERRLGRSRASPGRGGHGRPPAMGEARPLQIVFLLRVVDPEPASTADALPDEPK